MLIKDTVDTACSDIIQFQACCLLSTDAIYDFQKKSTGTMYKMIFLNQAFPGVLQKIL